MAKCIVCGGDFYDQTFHEPAEDCGCGNNINRSVEDDYDPQDIQDMRDDWYESLRVYTGGVSEVDDE